MGCNESRKKLQINDLISRVNSNKYQFEIYALIKQNDLDKIKDFIPKKFDVKFRMPVFMGKTVLHLAAEFCDRKMIAFILKNGADVNALDNSGCPALYAGMRSGNLETVNAILDIGTKVNTSIVTNHNLSFHDFINHSKKKESADLLRRIKYNKMV